ncbi:MAG: LLM class flavin-dependent oxidoreductase [Actinomyces sp.]|nr:MAG: LLM class flavin-dependent oxidoreductase [Actinomyces sp.]
MLLLRFDFRRAPFSPASTGELYAAALDMAAWADGHEPARIVVSEHHAADDDYLPSPLVMAAAFAARTRRVAIDVAALLALFYDPVRLAEDLAVLDHLSGGRVSATVGLGYRDEEYALYGVDRRRRGAELEERLEVVRRAWRGERFTWRGRRVAVTPLPATPGGPLLAYGGGSVAAARRAARLGLVFSPQRGGDDLVAAYDAEAERVGNAPGLVFAPPEGLPLSVLVSDDPDRAWWELGPYLLHDARSYAAWMGDSTAATISRATSVEELRAEEGNYRIVTPAGARELLAAHGVLSLQPLCGGIPPAAAWRSLELIADEVLA